MSENNDKVTQERKDDYVSSYKSDSFVIKRSTFNMIIISAVVALSIATFFGGFILGTMQLSYTSQQVSNKDLVLQVPTPTIQQQATPPSVASPSLVKIPSITLDGAPTKGKQDAPVTIVEFSDFQCPFCKRYFDSTFSQIEQDYVTKDKVKYIYKHYPLDFHANAKAASLAAECANEQGKFWEYHDTLFKNQVEWVNQNATAASITFKAFAAALTLDTNTFVSCVDTGKYQDKIDKDLLQGVQYGVSGTPTFYIGTEKQGYTQIVGAHPFSSFKAIIDNVLK